MYVCSGVLLFKKALLPFTRNNQTGEKKTRMDLQKFTSIATPANKEQLEENATHLKLKRKQWDESSSCSVCAGPITRQPSPHLPLYFYHSSVLHLAVCQKRWSQSQLFEKILLSNFCLISYLFFFFLFISRKDNYLIFNQFARLIWLPGIIFRQKANSVLVSPPGWANRLVIGHCVKWMCGIRHTPPSPLVSYQ